MRILLTNDDGIHAPGMAISLKIARDFGGPDAEIWVVAPMDERSGVAHCISYAHPVRTETIGERQVAVDGYPADCVIIAMHDLLKDTPPDLVISGVNRGNNAAENTFHSGTVGAAIQASMQGIKGVALSQFYGPDNRDLDNPFEAAEHTAPGVLRKLWDNAAWDHDGRPVFYNVNFPPVPANAVKGMKATVQGYRPGLAFAAAPYDAPNRRRYLFLHGAAQHVGAQDGSDVSANLDGYISVTPCMTDLTVSEMVAPLADALG